METQLLDEPWEGRDQWVWVTAMPPALPQYTEGTQGVFIAKWETGVVVVVEYFAPGGQGPNGSWSLLYSSVLSEGPGIQKAFNNCLFSG